MPPSRLFDLSPRERHTKGLSGTYDALITLVTLVGGIGLLARGNLYGLLLLGASAFCARDAYLKYRAGNWW
jgi:hypothetical protein